MGIDVSEIDGIAHLMRQLDVSAGDIPSTHREAAMRRDEVFPWNAVAIGKDQIIGGTCGDRTIENQ